MSIQAREQKAVQPLEVELKGPVQALPLARPPPAQGLPLARLQPAPAPPLVRLQLSLLPRPPLFSPPLRDPCFS
jgi:hypothetical protein